MPEAFWRTLMEDGRIERQMEFIVETLASLSVGDQKQNARLDKLIESHATAERRLSRYERILKLMIRAGRRERNVRSEADERLTKALAELAEAHKETEKSIAHTDSRLEDRKSVV